MLGRTLFTLAMAIAVLVAIGTVPDMVRLPDAPPRVAHGTIALLRVIDAGDDERLPLPPDGGDEPFGGDFAVDERGVLYLWDHELRRVLVYEDASLDRVVPVDSDPELGTAALSTGGVLDLGVDANGLRYDAREHRDGWVVARRTPSGEALTLVEILRDQVPVWDWYLRPDGTLFALSWREEGDGWRLSLLRLLTPRRV